MISHRKGILAIVVSCLAFTTPFRADTSSFDKVLSAVSLDFAGNGLMDRAVLVQGDNDSADLYLYLAKDASSSDSGLSLAEKKSNVVFSSGIVWGQLASLDVNQAGSLQIKSGNEGIGRKRWSQILTVVYRDKEFLIAGITYSAHDILDPKAGSECDINLLSGKGLPNGKPVETKFTPIRLSDWSDDRLPQECKF